MPPCGRTLALGVALGVALAFAPRGDCAVETAALTELLGAATHFLTNDPDAWNDMNCSSMQPPWVSRSRPLPTPSDPDKIRTHFFLFTRKNRTREMAVEVAVWARPEVDLKDRDWDPSLRTYFITHGLGSSSKEQWMQDMKEALLDKMDVNVFLTDWSGGSADFLMYEQAVANTCVVGQEMAKLIQHLISEHGSSPENMHLIGHSLGAHISAYTCKIVKNIARLTALDPAQPAFEGFNRQVRLDVSDATFVEVVHTDAKPTIPTFGLGMIGNYGDVDYYINGGASQPGCFLRLVTHPPTLGSLLDIFRKSISAINSIVSCPHQRATQVYTEAIQGNCTFWGHRGNFFNGIIGFLTAGHSSRFLRPSITSCIDDSCSPLGLDSESFPGRGSFVVPTAYSAPYCLRDTWLDTLIRQALLLPWRVPWLLWRFLWWLLSRVGHLLWDVPWSLVFAIID